MGEAPQQPTFSERIDVAARHLLKGVVMVAGGYSAAHEVVEVASDPAKAVIATVVIGLGSTAVVQKLNAS